MLKVSSIALLVSALFCCAGSALADGSVDFVARPKIGKAHLNLPSHLTWQASTGENGTYLVTLALTVDVRSVMTNIKALSAAALDRATPCGDLLKVLDAVAKLSDATTLSYDLRFHYAKRLCAGGMPLELPADINCSSIITLSASGTLITADIRGATKPPCSIDGTSKDLLKFASTKVFKAHTIDLAQQLPSEFRSVTVNVRSIAFDTPPASPRLRILGEGTMSAVEFKEFSSKIALYKGFAHQRAH